MRRKNLIVFLLIITLTTALFFSTIAAAAGQEPEVILYTVRAGDTLYEIAKAYDTTILDLRLDNGITDSTIYTGQVLKIRSAGNGEASPGAIAAETAAGKGSDAFSIEPTAEAVLGISTDEAFTANEAVNDSETAAGNNEQEKSSESLRSGITLEIRDADIRDVLSTLAVILKKNIIYTEESIRVSLSVQNVSAAKALDILTQSAGLTSITDGGTILVGTEAHISQNFYNLLPITRFSLKYLSPEQINAHVDKLGIPVQKIILGSTAKYIWAQGTPQALSKMRELVDALDRAENVDPVTLQPVGEFKLTPVELLFVESSVINTLITQLGIPCKTIVFETNPWTLWVDAEASALEDIMTLVESVDIPDNEVPEPVEEEEGEEEVVDTGIIEAKKMMNITSARLMPLITGLDIPVKIIAIDSSGYNIWMRGDRKSINIMNDLINRLDNYFSRDDVNFFIHTLENIKASTALQKLNFIGLTDVEAMSLNYPEYSRELLIACPSDRIVDVRNVIKKLDVPGVKIKAIVDSSTTGAAKSRLEARRDLIALLTGLSKDSFQVSQNVSKTEDPLFVLWVEETPDNIALIRNVISSIDAQGVVQETESGDGQ